MIVPVITNADKANSIIDVLIAESRDRLYKFQALGVKNLNDYNKRIQSLNATKILYSKLPKIILLIDDFADLMLGNFSYIERSIYNLTNMSRVTGIYLIIATQRPSVDTITGLIKSNMTSRIAFSVSNSAESRIILDMNGAEKLLGDGDMLFLPYGHTEPLRLKGTYVSDMEISDVVDFLKNQNVENTDIKNGKSYHDNIAQTYFEKNYSAAVDEYFADAGRFIIEKNNASIGILQRVLKIGFNRAARIMDELCDYGVVEEEEGTKPRKTLMNMEQFEELLKKIKRM